MNADNTNELAQQLREAALKRLDALRGTVIVGDILAPFDDEWAAINDTLSEWNTAEDNKAYQHL